VERLLSGHGLVTGRDTKREQALGSLTAPEYEGSAMSSTPEAPYDFLEQVLWAMIQATDGVLEIADIFAAGKEKAASGWATA